MLVDPTPHVLLDVNRDLTRWRSLADAKSC